mmetsp:Transcript_21872/g.36212  ORF Transcript_21872/g.36212 Transcript_21872/m.36212 type:complete len:206 (-) Transcript_21872:86-703(-)
MARLGCLVALVALFSLMVVPHGSQAAMNYIDHNIYVGDQHAAVDIPMLLSHNITAILNCAWDLDIRYDASDYVGNMADANENLVIQYAKVGLIDGSGNQNGTFFAGVYYLHQYFSPEVLEPKDQNTFKPVQNVLVHCHSGRSRSVTITALYLYYQYPEQFKSYDTALAFVKAQRGLSNDNTYPEPILNAQAHSIAAAFHSSIILW